MKKTIYNHIDDSSALLEVKISYYDKQSNGSWKKDIERSTIEKVSNEYYNNTIDAIPMFKDKVYRSYTKYGYIPTRLTAYSWGDGSTKVVREFTIIE